MSTQLPAGITLLGLPRLENGSATAETEARLVQQYREFRLAALKNDPDVFASSYAEEVGKDDAYWKQRLANPLAKHIIATTTEDGHMISDPKILYCNEWCGSIVVLGPLAKPSANESSTLR